LDLNEDFDLKSLNSLFLDLTKVALRNELKKFFKLLTIGIEVYLKWNFKDFVLRKIQIKDLC